MTTDPSPQGQEIVLSQRQQRAIEARDAMESGGRPAALVPRTFLEAQAFCGALASSALIPDRLRERAADVLVIVLAGIEIGLAPMQSLRLHHVIEGVPRLSADGMAAIVLASPACEYLECAESTDVRCTWVTKRRGRPERSCTWTIERAKRAGLVDRKNRDGSPGMWLKYPENMLSARARAELCRMVYPDVAGGMISREEAFDDSIDVEFTETKGPAAGFVAPPLRAIPRELTEFAPPTQAPKRGPGRPPRERPAEPLAEAPAEPAPSKLEAAIAKVEAKVEPAPVAVAPPPAPVVVAPPAPAAAAPVFGDDTAMPSVTIGDFHSWLAACRTQVDLRAGKDRWIAWSKAAYATGSPEAIAMQVAYGNRVSEVPE